MQQSSLVGLCAALASGLLIGIERERRKGTGSNRAFAGMRSFALVAVMGALAQLLQPALVWIGGLLVVALAAISHWRSQRDDPGVTTELSLFMAFLLGVNAIAEPLVSAGAAVVLAALLNLRDPLHHFSRVTLTTVELRDAMFLAGALVIVLPLLPDEPARWLAGANPHRLWLLVIVVMALQAGGHIALRLIGPTMGLPLSGFISGFISSTATIASMGARCRHEPSLLRTCTAGALASTIATFVLAFVVVLMVAPARLDLLAPSFGSALVCSTLVFAASVLGPRDGVAYPAPKGHAFSIWQALAFAAALTGITSAVGYGQRYFGQQSLPIGAGLAGLVDFHAAVGSLVSLAGSPGQGGADTTLLVLIAVSSNTLGKLTAACIGGGWRFGWRVGAGLLLILAAAWAPYFATLGS